MPDIEEFLQPISDESPAGEDVRYDIVYEQIRTARDQDLLALEPKEADYREARKLAEEVLRTRSKHLQVAAWLAEAWTHLEGVQGLCDGIELQRRLLMDFWDSVHPEIDDGDLEFRAAPVSWLAGYLGPSVRAIPLTLAGFDSIVFQLADKVPTEEQAAQNRDKRTERAAAVEEGKVTPEAWEEAVAATPKPFYKALNTGLAAALEATNTLEALCDEKFDDLAPGDRPSFKDLRDDIEAVHRIVRPILKRKLEEDPDPVEEVAIEELEEAVAAADDGGGVPIEPVSKKDADVRIAAAARFLRGADPHDPAPYLMIRGLRWGELRKGGGGVEPRLLAAPPTATRTRLKSLLLDGRWEELLENAEEVMASPFGRGWLDLQRYVFTALDGLGPRFESVEKALKGALRSLLVDLPELPDLTLMDDTPTANRETQRWLREEGLTGPLSEEEQARVDAGAEPAAAGGRDVKQRARERVRSGQPQKAIEMLMQAADRENSPRGRSLLRAEAAGIMVGHGLSTVAEPILRDIMAQIERHQLEDWEGSEVVAVPMATLYRCIHHLGGDEGEKQELYLRVCRLDPMQAILFNQHDEEEEAAEAEAADGDA